ncbi:MAG TPA: aminoglycoside phosphotransferase family protein [Rhodanobacteraceae bacterium]
MRPARAFSERDAAYPLNRQFECPACHASGSWVQVGKADARQNSTVSKARCMRCDYAVAVKASRTTPDVQVARAELLDEHQTLQRVASTFPQDGPYGTLVPLGYMDTDTGGVMLTRWFPGVDLVSHARTLGADAAEGIWRSAGAWLRQLHLGDPAARCTQPLGTAEKVAHLLETCGAVLRSESRTRLACGVLERAGMYIDELPLPAARLHGDFKPTNMLCDGSRYIGLDIQMKSIGAVAYDLAPFLNHLWLDTRTLRSFGSGRSHHAAEAAFLEGYGCAGEREMQALRWVQLYFALRYLGRYKQRGMLSRVYANRRVMPLVSALTAKVQEAC